MIEAIRTESDLSSAFNTLLPERRLFASIIMQAITDADLGCTATGVSQASRVSYAEQARKWILNNPICEEYCQMIDIDYRAMVEKLKRRWKKCPA